MKTKILIIIAVISLLVLTGCTQSIKEIKSDDYIDKKVAVKGMAVAPTKIGPLSGYTLVDENEDVIIVASENLPEPEQKMIVRGTLKKGLLGYYIDAN